MPFLLLALVLGALLSPPTPPATRTLTVTVQDLAGQPEPGVTLEVTGATVPVSVTDAGGVVHFAVLEDALTIVAARQDDRTLLLDRTSAAGLRVPVTSDSITLELWLTGDQLFVPPAGGGPVPDDLAGNTPASSPTAALAVTAPTLQPLDVDPPPPLPTVQDYAEGLLHHLRGLLVLLLVVVLLPIVLLLALALLAWTVHRRVRRRSS